MNTLARARQFATRTAEVVNTKTGRIVTLTTASMLVPLASAQTTTGGGTGLEFSAWISALQTTAVATINSAGPALFGLMALIGGVYFVWNRVRSLW